MVDPFWQAFKCVVQKGLPKSRRRGFPLLYAMSGYVRVASGSRGHPLSGGLQLDGMHKQDRGDLSC